NDAFDADLIRPVTLAEQWATAQPYSGAFAGHSQSVLRPSQVTAAQRLLDVGDLLSRLDIDAHETLVAIDQAVSAALSTRWVTQPDEGLAAVRRETNALTAE